MTLEEKIAAYKQLGEQLKELEAKKKALLAEILPSFPKDEKTMQVAGYLVRRFSGLSIHTPIEEAKALGAVKLEEVIDRAAIKKLHGEGREVPGVTPYEYITLKMLQPFF